MKFLNIEMNGWDESKNRLRKLRELNQKDNKKK